MAYDEKLTARIREALADVTPVEEKKMFSGVCFMVNDKMCVCSTKEGMLCRIGAANMDDALGKGGTEMIMRGRAMKDYTIVAHENIRTKKELSHWIELALSFNKEAKSSKKKGK